jgi:hypothetical protein
MSEQKSGDSIPSGDLAAKLDALETKWAAILAAIEQHRPQPVALSYAELHSVLFLGGVNHGLKLGDVYKKGHELIYDRAEKELIVRFSDKKGDHEAIIPLTNVASMHPRKEAKPIPIEQALPQPTARASAQVSSPTDHVFAGPGKGKR